jgi:hypothetical protein
MSKQNKTKGIQDKKTGQMNGSEKNNTPEEILEAFHAYMEVTKANPKIKQVPNTKTNSIITLEMEVPFTKTGFIIYLAKKGITKNGREILYNRDNRYSEFKEVIDYIDLVTYDDQLSGAIAGVFNNNVVIRNLGLSDKQEVKSEEKIVVDFNED